MCTTHAHVDPFPRDDPATSGIPQDLQLNAHGNGRYTFVFNNDTDVNRRLTGKWLHGVTLLSGCARAQITHTTVTLSV